MIPWLDFKIFGNGHGLSQPYCDGQFYWLVDTFIRDRDGRFGDFYTFQVGLGAQLHSYQWTHPKPREVRKLLGRRFEPFSSSRKCGRVEIAWAMLDLPSDLTERLDTIRAFGKDLCKPSPYLEDVV